MQLQGEPQIRQDPILLPPSGHLPATGQAPGAADTVLLVKRGRQATKTPPSNPGAQASVQQAGRAVHASSAEVTQVTHGAALLCVSQARTRGHVPAAGPRR